VCGVIALPHHPLEIVYNTKKKVSIAKFHYITTINQYGNQLWPQVSCDCLDIFNKK